MSQGHHHGSGGADGWEELAGARVRMMLIGVVTALGVATLLGVAIWWPRGEVHVKPEELGFVGRVDATVTSAAVGPCSQDPAVDCKALIIEVSEGEAEGTAAPLEFELNNNSRASQLAEGDKIVVNDAGADVPMESRFQFADVQRGSSLWLLAAVFAVAVVVLGRWRGLRALAGIVVSLGVLLVFIFPALLQGEWPLAVALTGSSVIAFATLYLAHGVSEHTTVALLGTLASLLLTAGLAAVFAGAAQLSGLAAEESRILLTFAPDLDFQGLLLAAVIIGTLGVLDDVTITQVSAVWELHRSDPEATGRDLYRSGIRIGRDHIASTVNTLVLAYSAAALPLLLLFTQSGLGLGDVLTSETIAVEVVQTLVGSIGLVASVPLTTALACWVVSQARSAAPEPAPAGFPAHRPSWPPEVPDRPPAPGQETPEPWF